MDEAVVYVVDDDESVCRALSRLFRSVGLEARTFPSATSFIDYAPPDRPACLVLDVRLPGPSGLDLQSALSQARPDIPIVFLTGYGSVPISVRAMKAGAVDFLEKPFNDQQLLDCVQRALERGQKERADRAERVELEHRLETLTPREREVLMLVVAAKPNKRIAEDLQSAEKTIKVHRGRVMKKMQTKSVADLVRMTQKLDLRPPRH